MSRRRTTPYTWTEFWDQCSPEPNTGCWLWAAGGGIGRGVCRVETARLQTVHRHALEWKLRRQLRRGEWACHRCGSGWCVNPDHIYLGNATSNAFDQWRGVELARRRRRGQGPVTMYVARRINPDCLVGMIRQRGVDWPVVDSVGRGTVVGTLGEFAKRRRIKVVTRPVPRVEKP